MLGEGIIQVETARNLGLSKTRVNYWARKFLNNGMVREKFPGRPKFYELTALGSKILTRSERDWDLPCVMEDYPVKHRLLKDHGLIGWEKLGQPRNWKKVGIRVGHCRVEKTSRSIIIHTGQLSGFDPDYLLLQAGQIIANVKAFLESHGVELDPVGLPLHKPIVKFYTPEAEILNKLYGTVSTEDGSLDSSLPDKIPHVEWNIETAKNYLEMPKRIRDISDRLNSIEHNQEILSQEQKEIKHNQKGSSENMLTFAQGMRDHLKLVHALTDVAEALKKESDVRREFYELETKRARARREISMGQQIHGHNDYQRINGSYHNDHGFPAIRDSRHKQHLRSLFRRLHLWNWLKRTNHRNIRMGKLKINFPSRPDTVVLFEGIPHHVARANRWKFYSKKEVVKIEK